MATTKKSVKKVIVKKAIVKDGGCPCGCGCDSSCNCCMGDSVKYANIWTAWRAFWRRGFTEWGGTSSRSEYWLSGIANLFVFAIGGLFITLFAFIETDFWGHPAFLTMLAGSIMVFYAFACAIPVISMTTRRMHDAGLSAWLWVVYILSVMPSWTEEAWALYASSAIGLIIALLPTQVHGNPYHKNNK